MGNTICQCEMFNRERIERDLSRVPNDEDEPKGDIEHKREQNVKDSAYSLSSTEISKNSPFVQQGIFNAKKLNNLRERQDEVQYNNNNNTFKETSLIENLGIISNIENENSNMQMQNKIEKVNNGENDMNDKNSIEMKKKGRRKEKRKCFYDY